MARDPCQFLPRSVLSDAPRLALLDAWALPGDTCGLGSGSESSLVPWVGFGGDMWRVGGADTWTWSWGAWILIRPPSACCLPRNMSVSRSTEDSCELDLVYVTERIIAVSFPSTANEDNFRSNLREVAQMLKSKHGGNYLVRMGPLARWPSVPVLSACHLLMVHLPCASFSFTCLWPRASLVA